MQRSAMRSTIRRITDAAEEPVTLIEAKAFADIEDNTEDALITELIVAARVHVEEFTGLALISQTWRMTLDHWPYERDDEWFDGVRELPITELESETLLISKAPFQSIIEIRTLDEDSAPTVWANTNYYTVIEQDYGRLCRKAGTPWPTTTRDHGGIEIDFVAGFGAAAANVPEDLKLVIRQLVKHWYDHPELMACENAGRDVPLSATAIMKRRKVRKL